MNLGVFVGIVSLNPLAPIHPVAMSTSIVVVRGDLDAVLGSAVSVFSGYLYNHHIIYIHVHCILYIYMHIPCLSL